MSEPLISSFLVSHLSESLRSLTKNKRCELIAQVTHQKWVTMSDSLTSLRGNEQSWANCSGRSPKMSEWVNRSFFWANRSFAHFWAKNERFARKTDEQIPSPAKNPESKLSLKIPNASAPICRFLICNNRLPLVHTALYSMSLYTLDMLMQTLLYSVHVLCILSTELSNNF